MQSIEDGIIQSQLLVIAFRKFIMSRGLQTLCNDVT